MSGQPRANRYRKGADVETIRRAHDLVARGFLDCVGSVELTGADTVIKHDTCHDAAGVFLTPLNASAAALNIWVSCRKNEFTVHGGAAGAQFIYMVIA